VISVVALEKARGIYLVASAPIEETIMDHKYKIHTAVMEYSNLATQRGSVKISFILFFTVVTTILLLSSILVGGIFANRILKPINKLISATKSVTSGNYDVLIKSEKYNSEFDILISTFNNMMSKLEQQKQQLIISNRQSAWRDIARKIAHEIKNPLTPIQLSAERLRNKYKDEIVNKPEVFNSCIDTIVRQVQCIGNLVKEFSDFARMPVPKMEKVDIVSVIKEAIVLQSNAHRYIRFHQFFDKESYICEIDQTQINQVLINVIQNAANAIVESRDIKSGNISVRFFVEGNMMNISIEDDTLLQEKKLTRIMMVT
jgi:two-component system nitrogen regulation sensor histidine kinase NtrY